MFDSEQYSNLTQVTNYRYQCIVIVMCYKIIIRVVSEPRFGCSMKLCGYFINLNKWNRTCSNYSKIYVKNFNFCLRWKLIGLIVNCSFQWSLKITVLFTFIMLAICGMIVYYHASHASLCNINMISLLTYHYQGYLWLRYCDHMNWYHADHNILVLYFPVFIF